jgi:sugar lactone lactonase YvrE
MRRSARLLVFLILGWALVPGARAGVLLVSGDPGVMKVDTNTGAVLGILAAPPSGSAFLHILLDRKGDLLAESSVYDSEGDTLSSQIVRLDGLTGASLGAFVPTGGGGLANPDGMAFGPDGNLYVLDFVNDNQWVVRKYDGTSGASLGTFATIATNFLTGPVFGPDGTLYLSDNSIGTVRKYNPAGQPIGFLFPAGGAPGAYGLAFGPDGNLYLSVDAKPPVLRAYNPTTGALVREVAPVGLPRANNLFFAPDGTLYLTTPDVPPGGIVKLSPTGTLTQLVADTVTIVGAGLSLPCNPQVNQVCMLDGRFRAEVTWQTPDGNQGQGRPVSYSDDTSEFWFFGPGNLEMVVKMVDGCPVNSHYWAFAGGLTNVAVTLTLTDTQTGKSKTYTNNQGIALKPVQDTAAFPSCP